MTVASMVLMVRFFGLLNLRSPSVVGVLYLGNLLFAFAPSIGYLGDPSRPSAGSFFLACALTSFLIPIGALISRVILTGSAREPRRLIGRPFNDDPVDERAVVRLISFLAVVVLVLLGVLVLQTGSIPIRSLLLDGTSSSSLREQRRAASGVGTILNVTRLFLVPFLVALIFASWDLLRRWRHRWLATIACLTGFVFNAYTSRKTPVVVLFFMALVIWLHYQQGSRDPRRVSLRRWRWLKAWRRLIGALAVVGLVGYPVFVFTLKPFGAERPIGEILTTGVFSRVIDAPSNSSYLTFELFPSQYDHTNGLDIPLVAAVTGGEFVNLSSITAVRKGFDSDANSPPSSIGAFYAAGGWAAIVFGVLVASMLFSAMEYLLRRAVRFHQLHLALYAVLLYGAIRFSIGYFSAILVTETIVPIILVLVGWHLVWNPRHRKVRRAKPLARSIPEEQRRNLVPAHSSDR